MMNKVFGDVAKDALYEAIRDCAIDYAKATRKDVQDEDVILVNNFIEGVNRFDLVEAIVDKIRENGYQISEKA